MTEALPSLLTGYKMERGVRKTAKRLMKEWRGREGMDVGWREGRGCLNFSVDCDPRICRINHCLHCSQGQSPSLPRRHRPLSCSPLVIDPQSFDVASAMQAMTGVHRKLKAQAWETGKILSTIIISFHSCRLASPFAVGAPWSCLSSQTFVLFFALAGLLGAFAALLCSGFSSASSRVFFSVLSAFTYRPDGRKRRRRSVSSSEMEAKQRESEKVLVRCHPGRAMRALATFSLSRSDSFSHSLPVVPSFLPFRTKLLAPGSITLTITKVSTSEFKGESSSSFAVLRSVSPSPSLFSLFLLVGLLLALSYEAARSCSDPP